MTRIERRPGAPIAIDPRVALTWIERIEPPETARRRDEIAIEEPLEIRVDGAAVAVTMRTPGEDEELAVGFLAGEALISGLRDLVEVGPTADLAANVIEVRTRRGLHRDPSAERSFRLNSSCGVCGKAALEHVRLAAPPSEPPAPVDPSLVPALPPRARAAQKTFDRTGGLHATALFDHTGELLLLREDVGRHNALDKAIGAMLLAGRHPLDGTIACLSGRISFEMVQKAALAGLDGIVAVGAPTSLAVDLARERGLLLCGFVRDERFNVYAGAELLEGSSAPDSAAQRDRP